MDESAVSTDGFRSKTRAVPALVPIHDNRVGGCPREVYYPEGWQLAKIPDEVRKCVAYLYYKTKENLEPMGTVFFVGYEMEHSEDNKLFYVPCFTYAVTSRHVVEKIKTKGVNGCTYIAMNGQNGTKILRQMPSELWQFPLGHRSDVAIVELDITRGGNADHLCFPQREFVSHDELESWRIGPGDEVFISGLFTGRPGNRTNNVPIVRVGNIAALPAGIIRTTYSDFDAYLVEARSIGGLSGSPVFYSVDLHGLRLQRSTYEPPNTGQGLHLLGYVQGHYDEQDGGEKLNSGIVTVVPAVDILAALENPVFADSRNLRFADGLERKRKKRMPTDD